LGQKIELVNYDTQTNAATARAQMQKALDSDPYVILGPIFSGIVKVSMALAQQAEIAQFIGGEAADLTHLGDPYLFRTSFGQQASMPKIANYIHDVLAAKSVAVVWVNNDFGKGGRDNFVKEMTARGIKIAADLSTESGQTDFSADVVKAKGANADAIFVYTNEEESARFLREARKQGIAVPLIGETTLVSQKVIELAGDAANGVRGHVGLSADAPIPAIADFKAKFQKRFNYVPDHNGIKGYTAVYAIRYVTEKKIGKLDRKAVAPAMHGLTITPEMEPGILIETTWDENGDIDRISFLAEVVNGKQQIIQTLPKLGK
jgi:branched-chain amino acid transport system substrate-binding protein